MKPLKLLLVEDSEFDATLLLRQIQHGGYEVQSLRVETAQEMAQALDQQSWDIIISDYVMPQFSGLAALELAKARGLDLPFIIVSGHIGEEIAVASMKAGAHDYVMKDKLARLIPAIERELREAEVRRQRRQSEQALRESEERFRQLAEHIEVVFFLSEELQEGMLGRISYVSPAYETIFGCPCETLYRDALAWLNVIHQDDRLRIQAALPRMSRGEFNEQFRILHPSRSVRWIQYRTFPVRNEEGKIYRIAGLAEDITARVEAQKQLEENARKLREQYAELKTTEEVLRATNEELRQAREHLEKRVTERTVALKTANTALQRQINERKRLENELLEIAEKERRRIGIDLHDELGQHLNGIALMLKGLELKLEKRGLPEAAESAKIQNLIFKTIQQARAVARDLASPDIEGDDLAAALRRLVGHSESIFQISSRLHLPENIPAFPQPVVKQLYKITQEAVTNAIKHGKAKQVEITLGVGKKDLNLQIQNDGLPFPAKRIDKGGMGLRIMQYRASVIGGQVTIEAGPNAVGTVVKCVFPICGDNSALTQSVETECANVV